MKPLISIITITYQAEASFRQTAESVLNQTYANIEYILIDGKSKDRTVSLISDYEKKFNLRGISFHWISEPDKGIYDAMNKGLQMATGDYVWFMNAGDRIASPDTLEKTLNTIPGFHTKAMNILETNSPDFIYGETYIVNEKGEIMGARRLKAPEKLNWKSFKMGMLVCHQSMIVKRSVAPQFDLQYKYSGDFDWAIRCLRKSKNSLNTHIILSHFLDGGVSKKKMKASLKERFQIMVKNYGLMPTVLRHLWFVCRASWFKLMHGWI
jgi:glycosyltransferase involved in cell wall biosynthesis